MARNHLFTKENARKFLSPLFALDFEGMWASDKCKEQMLHLFVSAATAYHSSVSYKGEKKRMVSTRPVDGTI
jgi:hypothetical protein